MEYRVEQLAAACDVSVDTVRFYQAKGLLTPPRRSGRVALYSSEHAERIRRIRSLQKKGLTLQAIERVVSGRLGRADQDLAAAVASAQAEGDAEEFISLEELAERSGVPAPLLASIEREGLPIGREIDGETRYAASDVELVRTGLRLLSAGLPLGELIALARAQNDATRAIAEEAVRLFDEYVRTPIKRSASSDEEAAEKLVAAFGELLPAVTALVAHHFRRVLLQVAEEHIEKTGDAAEIAATREQSRRRLEAAWPGE
ncbi:MAG TPA: MerR family transcriptional regulator [Actinomycetota bacterium]|nr:MerR family transcriptional regulator [Actinomycetota bacterium]